MEIDFYQFLNPYDVSFMGVCMLSIFFGIKNGILKSFLNLTKWVAIYFIIKNCFSFMRPLVDPYITNTTVSDIIIFLITIIISYLFLSFINRLIIGLVQPKNSFLIDLGLGSVFGIFRGYIIFVLIIFFVENNFSEQIIPEFMSNGSFQDIVIFGIEFMDHIPRNIENLDNLDI